MLRTALLRFNRTFMELKFRVRYHRWIEFASFNRTFMELKLESYPYITLCSSVLIVPLWN